MTSVRFASQEILFGVGGGGKVGRGWLTKGTADFVQNSAGKSARTFVNHPREPYPIHPGIVVQAPRNRFTTSAILPQPT